MFATKTKRKELGKGLVGVGALLLTFGVYAHIIPSIIFGSAFVTVAGVLLNPNQYNVKFKRKEKSTTW